MDRRKRLQTEVCDLITAAELIFKLRTCLRPDQVEVFIKNVVNLSKSLILYLTNIKHKYLRAKKM